MAKATTPVEPSTFAPLAADLDVVLRRLKLSVIRRLAPEVLQTAENSTVASEGILLSLWTKFKEVATSTTEWGRTLSEARNRARLDLDGAVSSRGSNVVSE